MPLTACFQHARLVESEAVIVAAFCMTTMTHLDSNGSCPGGSVDGGGKSGEKTHRLVLTISSG